MSPIIVLAGPTATGKTKLSYILAKKYNAYIINGDSRQVYKELSLGTAKPTDEEIARSGIDHYLFGHVSINEEYNLYTYQQDVFNILRENKNQVAIIVGGSGLYIDSVVYNYKLSQNTQDSKYRSMTLQELQKEVGGSLSELNNSDRKNPHRLIRFLERGKKKYDKGKPLNHFYLVYSKDFKEIEENIIKRIDTMFESGLEEENRRYKDSKSKALDTLAYTEFKPYFEGKRPLAQVRSDIIVHTRQYAKRQITWFKRNKNVNWISSEKEALLYCDSFLTNILP